MADESYALERKRGDTKPFVFQLWEDKAAGIKLTITGYTFRFSANSLKDPVDISTQIFTLNATIIGEGKIMFEPSGTDTDVAPGTYYYDLEITDTDGKIDTPIKDRLKIVQDISK